MASFRRGLPVAAGVSGLADGLGKLASQGDALAAGAQSIQKAVFDSVNAQLAGMGLPALTPDNYSTVLSGNGDLAAVKAQLDNAVQFTQGVLGYTSGVAGLQAGTDELSGGASQLSAALSQAVSGAQDLYNGAAQLNSATGALRDGLSKFRDGTAELQGGTEDLDSQVSEQIDNLLSDISGGDVVKSFVSDKVNDIYSVQFVMKTGSIEIPKADNAETVQEKVPDFWDRLLALFGIRQ